MKNYQEPYHYIQCGLDNVYLRNGFTCVDSRYGKGISIKDVEGLHRLIGQFLTNKTDILMASEIRFLRTELDMSQKRLGELIGKDPQTIAYWERGRGPIPKESDFCLRHIYLQHLNKRAGYVEMVDKLNGKDREDYGRIELQEVNQKWKISTDCINQ